MTGDTQPRRQRATEFRDSKQGEVLYMGSETLQAAKPRASHIWKRQATDFYVEPEWCSLRLFEEETFEGFIYDPAAGMGRIVRSAHACGHAAIGTDIRPRDKIVEQADFLTHDCKAKNIVTNPPFDLVQEFTLRAFDRAKLKVAIIFPTARLNAAGWLEGLPLERIWLLTPRPSMPPGEVVLRGEKPGGGRVDYCWLVFDKSQHISKRPELRWLHREKK
jgi:hypothetical protein